MPQRCNFAMQNKLFNMLRKIITITLLLVIATSCSKTTDAVDYSVTDKKIIEDYLLAHNLTAQSTTSGLYYIIKQPGGAYHANIHSQVSALYKGYLVNDTVFDQSTLSYNNPATFSLASVIKGWQIGIPLIGVGGKIKLLVPSALGYGSVAKTLIPANSVLIFDIEIVDIYN